MQSLLKKTLPPELPGAVFTKRMQRALRYPLTYYTASKSGRTMAYMEQGEDGHGHVVVVQDGQQVATVRWHAEGEEPIPKVG